MPMLPWSVDMLTLTSAGSVGTSPVRGGLLGLLAAWAAGYWQFLPRSAGALNAGSCPLAGGAGSVGSADEPAWGDGAAVGVPLAECLGVKKKAAPPATTATTTRAEAMIVYSLRLRAWASRRSSCRSSLRFAVARRCSLVGTAVVLLMLVSPQRVCQQ